MERKFRYKIAFIPATIFWAASMVFFILGLAFGTIGQATTHSIMFWVSVGLAISNTIIQIMGNDAEPGELGLVLFWGWIASYGLGIGSNVNSLIQILNIQNRYLEWLIAISLGTMIEVMPERLWVLFWRSTFPHGINLRGFNLAGGINSRFQRHQYYSSNSGTSHPSSRPKGMPRSEWQAELERRFAEERRERKAHDRPTFVGNFTDEELEALGE